jgi:hypothetical protein
VQGVYNDEDDADSGITKLHSSAVLHPDAKQENIIGKYLNGRDVIDEEALSEGGNGAITFKKASP